MRVEAPVEVTSTERLSRPSACWPRTPSWLLKLALIEVKIKTIPIELLETADPCQVGFLLVSITAHQHSTTISGKPQRMSGGFSTPILPHFSTICEQPFRVDKCGWLRQFRSWQSLLTSGAKRAMALRQVKVSDIDGAEGADVAVVVRDYPGLDQSKTIDVTPEQRAGLAAKALKNVMTLEIKTDDGEAETILVTKAEFDKWLGEPAQVLKNARNTRGRVPGSRINGS